MLTFLASIHLAKGINCVCEMGTLTGQMANSVTRGDVLVMFGRGDYLGGGILHIPKFSLW
jgi:hypothetical protein